MSLVTNNYLSKTVDLKIRLSPPLKKTPVCSVVYGLRLPPAT